MTHKYLSQIRTIPNYYEDQSDFAKNWRKAKYTFKTVSNIIIKNKKTRIITSVLAVYLILTSGFLVAFINVDNNQANAQSFTPIKNLDISIKKQKVETDNIVVRLEVQNNTNQTIVNPVFQFQSSFNNVEWMTSFDDSNNNKVDSQGSVFKLNNINPNQKTVYNVYGKLSNINVTNIVVTANANYASENKSQEVVSPKFLIDLR